MELRKIVAKNIRKRREKIKMSRTTLAEKTGKSLSAVTCLELKATDITVSTLDKYAKALMVDVCDLVKGER